MSKEVHQTDSFKDLTSFLVHYEFQFMRVGSSKIPGVKDPNDYDILVLEKDGMMSKWMDEKCWIEGGSNLPDQDFTSYSTSFSILTRVPSGVNVILAHSEEFYNKFVAAQKSCEEAGLKYRHHRLEVFKYFLDYEGKPSEERFVNLCLGNVTEGDYFDDLPF
jgi:hypothetical protein